MEFSDSTRDPAPVVATVERPARLFRCGDYPDKGLTIVADDLDGIVLRSTEMPEIPLDLSPHGNSDLNLPVSFTGGIVPSSIRRVGEFIDGIVKLPQNVFDALKTKYPDRIPLSVVLDRVTRAIKKVAVVPKGRVPEASFAAGDYCFDGEIQPAAPPPDDKTTTENQEKKAEPEQPTDASSIQGAIQVLGQLGLTLPDDTTPTNIIERINTAGGAVLAAKSSTDDQTAGQEKEVPAPIAMSDKGKPMSEPTKPVSDIQFKAPTTPVSVLPKTHRIGIRKAYASEIERHVNRFAITPQYANEVLAPYLGASVEDFQFGLDESTMQATHPVLDPLLQAIDALPDGSVLNGPVSEVERRTKKRGKVTSDVAFSLKIAEHQEEEPAEFAESSVVGADGKPTAEQADTTNSMLQMAGVPLKKAQ